MESAKELKRAAAMSKCNVNRLTFGIEIELLMPWSAVNEYRIQVGSYNHGSELPQPLFPEFWMAKYDGSLQSEDDYCAFEVVSPVLQGEDGIEQVMRVVNTLNDLEAKVNLSCGVHVHVGMKSIMGDDGTGIGSRVAQAEFMRHLLNLVSQHELALFAIGGRPSRVNNRYCPSVKNKYAGINNRLDKRGQLEYRAIQ